MDKKKVKKFEKNQKNSKKIWKKSEKIRKNVLISRQLIPQFLQIFLIFENNFPSF